MTSLWRHYDIKIGIFQGHVTLSFLKVEAQNFVSWGVLTCFLGKLSLISISSVLFHLLILYSWLHNDVIRRYTEQVILFLATKTYHRVTRKLSFSDLFLVYPNNEIKTPKRHKFDILWRYKTFAVEVCTTTSFERPEASPWMFTVPVQLSAFHYLTAS